MMAAPIFLFFAVAGGLSTGNIPCPYFETTATAPSTMSPKKQACFRFIPRRLPRGPISTTTAGSICLSATKRPARRAIRVSFFTIIRTELSPTSPRSSVLRNSEPNLLFRNDGPHDRRHPDPRHWQFTDVTQSAGVANPLNSFATWFFDYDNDGWPDIFVAGYWMDGYNDIAAFEMLKRYKAETPRLYRNNHDGTFTDITKKARLDRAILVMGASFGDLDTDGWLDIYLGTGEPAYEALLPNRLFRNNEGKFFQDVTFSADVGHLQKGHGVAFGDLRNNGQEDIFEVLGGAFPGDTYQSALFANPGHANHWVTL